MHKDGACKAKLTNTLYGFWPHEDQKKHLTTYGFTLDHCPLENPQPWLMDLLEYMPIANDLDLQNSSMDFVADVRYAQGIERDSRVSLL